MKNNQSEVSWLAANWPAPSHIHAGTILRTGGVSSPPYNQLNLAVHVNDNPENVLVDRERLTMSLKLPTDPVWLNQAHGNHIIRVDSNVTEKTADGSYSTEANKVCVIMTADCLPLLLCGDEGRQAAAVHIGWRGFSKNIIAGFLINLSALMRKF